LTLAIKRGLLGKEDISWGSSTFTRVQSDNTNLTLTQVNDSFIPHKGVYRNAELVADILDYLLGAESAITVETTEQRLARKAVAGRLIVTSPFETDFSGEGADHLYNLHHHIQNHPVATDTQEFFEKAELTSSLMFSPVCTAGFEAEHLGLGTADSYSFYLHQADTAIHTSYTLGVIGESGKSLEADQVAPVDTASSDGTKNKLISNALAKGWENALAAGDYPHPIHYTPTMTSPFEAEEVGNAPLYFYNLATTSLTIRTWTWSESDKNINISLSDENLTCTATNTAWKSVRATGNKGSGKWYWEVMITVAATTYQITGAMTNDGSLNSYVGSDTNGYGYAGQTGNKWHNGSDTAYGDTFGLGDIIGVALDLDNGEIYFSKNGVWQNSSDPVARTNPAFTGLSGVFYPAHSPYADTNAAKARFTGTEVTYSVPDGFSVAAE